MSVNEALQYAKGGWFVFPLYGIQNGLCECGNPESHSFGKHPRTLNGFKDSTNDPEIIMRWWSQWPNANIGIATGESNLVVLDIDPRHGGDETFRDLESKYGKLPSTIESITGGGGRHIFFKAPNQNIQSKAGSLGHGLDIRATGGYVVAPPSSHASSRSYVWEISGHPDEVELADLPPWLFNLLIKKESRRAESNPHKNKVPEGERNNYLASRAGTMKRGGFAESVILAALLEENRLVCDPPLPDSEVELIAKSISRYTNPTEETEKNSQQKSNSESSTSSPWALAEDMNIFLSKEEIETQWIKENLLARGIMTGIAAPRGLGKTNYIYYVVVKIAKNNYKVLLIDRDNPPQEIRKRLKKWGGENLTNLKVLSRDKAPPLTNHEAWKSFPIKDYDVIIVDSYGAFTEGVGEKDTDKTGKALACLLDLKTQDLAVVLILNTPKDGKNYRGNGSIADRVDLLYEVRDATGLKPTGKKAWWLELPEPGESEWAERARRRKNRDNYRLAFIPSKCRIDREPEPWCVEITHSKEGAWTVIDVTDQLEIDGEQAVQQNIEEKKKQIESARKVLSQKIKEAALKNENFLFEKDAVPFLMEEGLKRHEARNLIEEGDGKDWKIEKLKGQKGSPNALFPIHTDDNKSDGGNNETRKSEQERDREGPFPPSAQDMSGGNTCQQTHNIHVSSEDVFPPDGYLEGEVLDDF